MSVPVDVPGDYARGLLERLGDRDPWPVLDATPGAVRAMFEGMDDAAIRRPEREGKWSMLDVAHHFADGEMVVAVRVRMIVSQDQPPVIAYDQDLWSQTLRYREANLQDVLEQFDVVRRANMRAVRRLTPAQLQRFGVHTERGGETVGYIMRLMAGHDLVHLDQLARIKRAVT